MYKTTLSRIKQNNGCPNGYSLVELLIVAIITTIVLAGVIFQFGSNFLAMSMDETVGNVATVIFEAKAQAKSGNANPNQTTINVNTMLVKPHNGITVTVTAIASVNACQGNCPDGQLSICVSGERFCFSVANTFSFERFSGRTSEPRAIFISSKNRKMAVLVNKAGNYSVAELVNNEWHSRRDLQNLFPSSQSISNSNDKTTK